MASRRFVPLAGAQEYGLVLLAGTVTWGASSAVASQNFDGGTFAKTGTGVWTLTLDSVYNSIVSVMLTPLAATYSDRTALIKSKVSSTGVITIHQGAAGTVGHPTSGDKLHVLVFCRQSSVAP